MVLPSSVVSALSVSSSAAGNLYLPMPYPPYRVNWEQMKMKRKRVINNG